MVWSTIGMSLRQIGRNKMRSFLTALGIVIGVGAVIAMVHLGDAATRNVTDRISAMGQNLLMVQPGTRRRGPGGSRSEAKPFDERVVRALESEVSGAIFAPSASSRATVVLGNTNWPTTVTGTTNGFFKIRDWPVVEGREFEAGELRAATPVCIVGKTIVDEVFGGTGALDAQLRVGKLSCRVIGVLESKSSMMGQDQDDLVLMPLSTFQRRIAGNWDISMVYVSALVDGTTEEVQSQIETVLREKRRIAPGADDDFNVRDMAEIAETVSGTFEALSMLLSFIAAVSLLVGGIGIMNIMLVSVTERTREIGIRLAIGARGREVLWQFLIESAVLSGIGGLLGIGVGLGGAYGLCQLAEFTFAPVPSIIVIAFLISAVIGVMFGFWPAYKAARLDPIEALRHE
ncbi:MAG: FtsX-like permease family protein [Deltaproteobacteria bacterium]|nr:MAG: FtsX-like permease family protein [Deltaproteobacteria bacterium]